MTRLRALCALAVVAGALIVPAGAGPACASGPHAGLVVDTGARVLRYCVELPSQTVSGAKLIELAGDQYGLDYHFGSGGGAVCRLAGVGPDGSDCFGDYPDYWGYWRGTASGDWTWSSSGATSTTVSEGDVDGWAWGSGDDGSTHPKPPASTFGSVCAAALAQHSTAPPRSTPAPRPSTASSTEPIPTQPPPGRSGRGHPAHRKDPPDHHRSRGRPSHRHHKGSGYSVRLAPSPVAAPVRVNGPPLLGLLAIAAVCAIGVAGAIVTRRRRSVQEPR
ncbi:MAG: hypothetical protein QOF16_1530 [Actinomycetota bacterium]|nr:hypothetical protein [Actinomycetota bacterium]